MKYPNVLFLRNENCKHIDRYINRHGNLLECTFCFTNNVEDIMKFYSTEFHILITYGSMEDYSFLKNKLSPPLMKRWIHKTNINTIEELNKDVNFCFISNIINSRDLTRPAFSIFTTCYNSYDKIYRAYKSLSEQTFIDWEWVIVDDSPDDKHFDFLRDLVLKEGRIRLYRREKNSGSIGNVKNEAVSLCRGKYALELDHDDEILPDVLECAYNAFEDDLELGFIYMDFINMYENSKPFHYGPIICKGYGAYYSTKYKGKWQNVYSTPNINNITLSHLVCMPNHPRIWRTEVLRSCGNYSELLPICDDYEILLRTLINHKCAKIHKLGYIQYMNDDNNNFSLIRNSEINRIGPEYIYPMFYEKYNVHKKMEEKEAFETKQYLDEGDNIWKRTQPYEHKFCNTRILANYTSQVCLIGLKSLDTEEFKKLNGDPTIDFLLLDNKDNLHTLQTTLDERNLDFIKCYSLVDCTNDELKNFFHLMYQSTSNVQIILPEC